ncbi:hypothetical protein PFISCL1PPCAC_8967, partial [Pristionchus fissidentatus]
EAPFSDVDILTGCTGFTTQIRCTISSIENSKIRSSRAVLLVSQTRVVGPELERIFDHSCVVCIESRLDFVRNDLVGGPLSIGIRCIRSS